MDATVKHDGIRVDVIGDAGPFSMIGRSIGYQVTVRGARYLVDCGAPVFQLLGVEGIKKVRGIVGTHSHEDHRRWFTDMALFKRYTPGINDRVRLITTEAIHDEFEKNSKGALERSLSADSKRVVEIPYRFFVDPVVMGPRSRYRLMSVRKPGEEGPVWRVVDSRGEVVPPDRAKVVINPEANRPRMLLRDETTGEWVEPESFYDFADRRFYEADPNPFFDREAGLKIEAIKAPIWHGPPTIGVKFSTGKDTLVFSSDTHYDPALWEEMAGAKLPQKLGMGEDEFRGRHVIIGDINHYIERAWSRERLAAALEAYKNAVVIHDVADKRSIVHTDYKDIVHLKAGRILLTHSPDRFVTTEPLASSGKAYQVIGSELFECVGEDLCHLDADAYFKNYEHYVVAYASPRGRHVLVRKEDGLLDLVPREDAGAAKVEKIVELLIDIQGRYFPHPGKGEPYRVRPDGAVEKVEYTHAGSRGRVMSPLPRNVRS
ncbi:MAG: hypothetical protein V1809_11685 [Planctomycetota bacterium]